MDTKSLNHKKAWQKPELIVLVRSNPEEAVLLGCKISKVIGPGNKNTCKRGQSGCLVIGTS